jgi:hypothetical protein
MNSAKLSATPGIAREEFRTQPCGARFASEPGDFVSFLGMSGSAEVCKGQSAAPAMLKPSRHSDRPDQEAAEPEDKPEAGNSDETRERRNDNGNVGAEISFIPLPNYAFEPDPQELVVAFAHESATVETPSRVDPAGHEKVSEDPANGGLQSKADNGPHVSNPLAKSIPQLATVPIAGLGLAIDAKGTRNLPNDPAKSKTVSSEKPALAEIPVCKRATMHLELEETASSFLQSPGRKHGDDLRRQLESNPGAVAGTASANQELGMKMMVNEPESAAGIEQKLPHPEKVTHLPPDSPVSVLPLEAATGGKVSIEPISTTMASNSAPGSTRAERLYQSMLPEVAMVKALRPDSLSVVLKPDRETEIFVRVTVEDGKMQAYARCDRGDIAELNAEWAVLQKSLATHGVNLGSLNSGLSDSANNFNSSGGHQQPETPSPFRDEIMPVELKGRKTDSTRKFDLHGRNLNQLLESWA